MIRNKRWLIAAVIVAIGLLLFIFDPVQTLWSPKCVVKAVTGYDCPGCGFQRAAHAVLHGRFMEAAHYNLFLLFALPYLFLLVLSDWLLRGKAQAQLKRFTHHRYWLWTYIVLFFTWWILRNLLGL